MAFVVGKVENHGEGKYKGAMISWDSPPAVVTSEITVDFDGLALMANIDACVSVEVSGDGSACVGHKVFTVKYVFFLKQKPGCFI